MSLCRYHNHKVIYKMLLSFVTIQMNSTKGYSHVDHRVRRGLTRVHTSPCQSIGIYYSDQVCHKVRTDQDCHILWLSTIGFGVKIILDS